MTTQELIDKAKTIRLEAIRMIYESGDGHPGPALSIADIITVLYFDEMKIDPLNPRWEDRDRLIVSKGHACPIIYSALNERGYFGEKIREFHLRELGSRFQGHPDMNKTPGVDMTTGSLGNGIAIGTGMSIAGKYLKKDNRVYVIVGDGEMQEGVAWEGVNAAAAHKLDNLVVFVDKNGWQSGGCVTDIIGTNNVRERFEEFNWFTQEIDGNDIDEIKHAISIAKKNHDKPSAIICNCIKGKGVSFMENNNDWHKKTPTDEQFEIAKKELGGGK